LYSNCLEGKERKERRRKEAFRSPLRYRNAPDSSPFQQGFIPTLRIHSLFLFSFHLRQQFLTMSGYYNVQEFLADSQVSSSLPSLLKVATERDCLQRLPSKVLFDIPNCGHLEGSADKDVRPHLHDQFTLSADVRIVAASSKYNSRITVLASNETV